MVPQCAKSSVLVMSSQCSSLHGKLEASARKHYPHRRNNRLDFRLSGNKYLAVLMYVHDYVHYICHRYQITSLVTIHQRANMAHSVKAPPPQLRFFRMEPPMVEIHATPGIPLPPPLNQYMENVPSPVLPVNSMGSIPDNDATIKNLATEHAK